MGLLIKLHTEDAAVLVILWVIAFQNTFFLGGGGLRNAMNDLLSMKVDKFNKNLPFVHINLASNEHENSHL